MSILPDEVLTSAPSVDDERPGESFSTAAGDPVAEPAAETNGPSDSDGPDDGGARVEVVDEVSVAEEAAADPEARAAYLDLTTPSSQADQIGEADRWGPGSWSEIAADFTDDAESEAAYARAGAQESTSAPSSGPAASSGPAPTAGSRPTVDDRPTQAVPRADTARDRYMEELDSAVNEAVELDDDAMKAFFEGSSDPKARRFGWRR